MNNFVRPLNHTLLAAALCALLPATPAVAYSTAVASTLHTTDAFSTLASNRVALWSPADYQKDEEPKVKTGDTESTTTKPESSDSESEDDDDDEPDC